MTRARILTVGMSMAVVSVVAGMMAVLIPTVTERTARTAVEVQHTITRQSIAGDADDDGVRRDVYMFTVPILHGKQRMKVTLNTQDFRQELWDSAAARESMYIDDDGWFYVNVWLVRAGLVGPQKIDQVRMPAIPNEPVPYYVKSVFQQGDTLAFDAHPGVQYKPGRDGEPGVPFASIVDNTSNDPATIGCVKSKLPPVVVEVH
jgi:hypothetical protein